MSANDKADAVRRHVSLAIRSVPAPISGIPAIATLAASWAIGVGQASGQVIELPAEDRPLTADFEELYRVGGAMATGWAAFGEVGAAAFDGDGNLYVYDSQIARFFVIGPNGDLLTEFGGIGEGPGEIRMQTEFGVTRDGRVVSRDLAHNGYQVFGPKGEFIKGVEMGDPVSFGVSVGSGSVRFQAGSTPSTPLRLAPDGSYAVVSSLGSGLSASLFTVVTDELAILQEEGDDADGEADAAAFERHALTGDEVSVVTLASPWTPIHEPIDVGIGVSDGMTSFSLSVPPPMAFKPSLYYDLLPDGRLLYSDSSTYAIKTVASDGTPSAIWYRPLEPEPVTDRMRDAEKERRIRVEQSGWRRYDNMLFWTEVPVVRGLSATWEGSVWVRRRGDEPWNDEGPIDVLSSEGAYLGTLAQGTAMPAAFGPEGLAAYLETDEFDAVTVVVRRLTSEAR